MLTFLKLGGSLLTDKTHDKATRPDVIARIAHEIAGYVAQPQRAALLLGHGSGSFGHTAAKKYGTRSGVHDAEGWRGFAEVSVVAAQLNRIVADALASAGVPELRHLLRRCAASTGVSCTWNLRPFTQPSNVN